MYPILGISGKAGSGKDTAAAKMAEMFGAIPIALADPMKRLAETVYRFTPDQLWGPSESRNAPDCRYNGAWPEDSSRHFNAALDQLLLRGPEWVKEILPTGDQEEAFWQLKTWAHQLAAEHMRDRKILTPRRTLQTLGTEWGRQFNQNIWVDCCLRMCDNILNLGGGYCNRIGRLDGIKTRPAFMVITDVRFANEVLAIKRAGGKVLRIVSPDEAGLAGEAGQHSSETEQEGIPDSWFDLGFVNDKRKGIEALGVHVKWLVGQMVTR